MLGAGVARVTRDGDRGQGGSNSGAADGLTVESGRLFVALMVMIEVEVFVSSLGEVKSAATDEGSRAGW